MLDNMNNIDNVIKEINLKWNKDKIIRFLYVKLAPFFQRDLSYFLADSDEQLKIYQNGFKQKSNLVVCQTICEIYKSIYEEFNIKCLMITTNAKSVPHYALIVNGNYGWYYIDPLKDLFANQLGLKTQYFGCIPSYGTVKSEYPYLINLSEQYITSLDTSLKIIESGFYMDTFFDIINQEMTNNKVYKFFEVEKNNHIQIILKKLQFVEEHLINMGHISGLYERCIFYKFIIDKIYIKNEKKCIEPSLVCDKNSYALLLNLDFKKNNLHITCHEEKNNDGRYYLRKTKGIKFKP